MSKKNKKAFTSLNKLAGEVRTAEAVNQEYSQLCMQVGDLVIKQRGLDQMIDQHMVKVRQLNSEMLDIQHAAAKAAAAAPTATATAAE